MALNDPAAFYAALRGTKLFPKLQQSQVDGINRLLAAFSAARWGVSWSAYGLATSYHETDKKMQPCREKGNGDGPDADPWDDYLERYDTGILAKRLGNTPEADGDGVKYAGAGDVQLTGLSNYKWAQRITGFPLVAKPELMLDPAISAKVLVVGLETGAYTGKGLGDYLPRHGKGDRGQFRPCRRCVNSLDRADDIAGYALGFQGCMIAGQWRH